MITIITTIFRMTQQPTLTNHPFYTTSADCCTSPLPSAFQPRLLVPTRHHGAAGEALPSVPHEISPCERAADFSSQRYVEQLDVHPYICTNTNI